MTRSVGADTGGVPVPAEGNDPPALRTGSRTSVHAAPAVEADVARLGRLHSGTRPAGQHFPVRRGS